MAYFCSSDFAVWEDPPSLKQRIEIILHIELKHWQGYFEILESVPVVLAKFKLPWNFQPWNFHPSLRAAVPLLKTDNLSPICRCIIEIWPVLMAWTWQNCVFALSVPLLVQKHNSRFRVFWSTIYWSLWLTNIYETFGGMKIAISLRNVVSAPSDLRMSLFVDCWL